MVAAVVTTYPTELVGTKWGQRWPRKATLIQCSRNVGRSSSHFLRRLCDVNATQNNPNETSEGRGLKIQYQQWCEGSSPSSGSTSRSHFRVRNGDFSQIPVASRSFNAIVGSLRSRFEMPLNVLRALERYSSGRPLFAIAHGRRVVPPHKNLTTLLARSDESFTVEPSTPI